MVYISTIGLLVSGLKRQLDGDDLMITYRS